jgi:hypothetical protein
VIDDHSREVHASPTRRRHHQLPYPPFRYHVLTLTKGIHPRLDPFLHPAYNEFLNNRIMSNPIIRPLTSSSSPSSYLMIIRSRGTVKFCVLLASRVLFLARLTFGESDNLSSSFSRMTRAELEIRAWCRQSRYSGSYSATGNATAVIPGVRMHLRDALHCVCGNLVWIDNYLTFGNIYKRRVMWFRSARLRAPPACICLRFPLISFWRVENRSTLSCHCRNGVV